uniref:EF-hand domain-containing protein n=1 Tax=Mola mola TaxID=94237 RepID=A0A3Q3WKP1_MOLML
MSRELGASGDWSCAALLRRLSVDNHGRPAQAAAASRLSGGDVCGAEATNNAQVVESYRRRSVCDRRGRRRVLLPAVCGRGLRVGEPRRGSTLSPGAAARPYSLDDGDVYMSSHENRFRLFSSVEYEGQLYMTPLNFIESLTFNEPKSEIEQVNWDFLLFWQELDKMLADTPPVWKGSSNLFRNLRERGVISYTEYLFLLCILTKPQAGFRIAFNMFDADGNEMLDKREFLVVLIKDSQHVEARGMWDVLRCGSSQVLFSDLTEKIETTLLVHFFGKKGKAELKFEDFYKFMDNLQTEVLEIEFLCYSKGLLTISEEDFARILLRYTNVDDVSRYLENMCHSIPDEKGISFEEFRSFFQFLNNLEDFTIAMQMYNFANRPVGQEEFTRAVYVATGIKLTQHLVNTVFKIFDEDHDNKLSHKEFIGIMKEWLHRGDGVRQPHLNDIYPLCY